MVYYIYNSYIQCLCLFVVIAADIYCAGNRCLYIALCYGYKYIAAINYRYIYYSCLASIVNIYCWGVCYIGITQQTHSCRNYVGRYRVVDIRYLFVSFRYVSALMFAWYVSLKNFVVGITLIDRELYIE